MLNMAFGRENDQQKYENLCMLYRLQKTFEKVSHSKLIQVLRKYDVPSEEIRLT